jgi:proline iminopeptidase
MMGSSERACTSYRIYDATPFLPQIRIPTVYTVGEFDEAGTTTVRRFASLTPGAQVAVLAGAAHITPWDAPEENVRVVREF